MTITSITTPLPFFKKSNLISKIDQDQIQSKIISSESNKFIEPDDENDKDEVSTRNSKTVIDSGLQIQDFAEDDIDEEFRLLGRINLDNSPDLQAIRSE